MRSLLVCFIAIYTITLSQLAHSIQVTATWDERPVSEQITHYTVYKNTLPVGESTLPSYNLNGDGGDCFSVSASNLLGESLDRSNEVCLPSGLPSAPVTIIISVN